MQATGDKPIKINGKTCEYGISKCLVEVKLYHRSKHEITIADLNRLLMILMDGAIMVTCI